MSAPYSQPLSIDPGRRERLTEEITAAIAETSSVELQTWGKRIPATMATITKRRGKNFGNTLRRIGQLTVNEGSGMRAAIREGKIKEHLQGRGQAAIDTGIAAKNALSQLSSTLKADPKKEIPKLAVGVIGFLAASGGVDGDGGVPDLDFLGGIGAHRSILTHSIIAGIVIETLLVSISDLAKTVHKNLPDDHDPLWESLVAGNEELLLALSQGMRVGIAYHLGVDATIDGDGMYRDLPISLPQDAHQVIIAANAAVEGIDSLKRTEETDHELQRVFKSFKEASEFARRQPGTTIVRDKSGHGFVVK